MAASPERTDRCATSASASGWSRTFAARRPTLAANEERANLARELHDSVTQALFSMGLTARALELLLDRDPAGGAREAGRAA